jgi:hypothetical protein
MLDYLLIGTFILVLFPKGRRVLKKIFKSFLSIVNVLFSDCESSSNSGPHYDLYTEEVHAYKQPSGMYRK